MAKQTINQGTAPTGAGGDTFRTGSAKLQANDDELYDFIGGAANTTALPAALPLVKGGTGATTAAAARTNLGLGTAATKNVGTAADNVMAVGAFGLGSTVIQEKWSLGSSISVSGVGVGFYREGFNTCLLFKADSASAWGCLLKMPHHTGVGVPQFRRASAVGSGILESSYQDFYTTVNTTVDSNGFLKNASPIVELYADKIELNDEAKQQSITFERLGTGDYLLKGSTGFAQESWYVEQPKDANGNVYHAVVYDTLENGDISVKTYEQKLEGTRIVADLEKPVDIKENRFISLRLNELPQDTTAPQNPNVVDNAGNPAPSHLHELEEGVWVISDENAAILEQERLAAMPALKRRQFRLTLAMNGYDLKEIETLIDQIEDPMQRTIAQIEWQDATDFERTNPTLLKMAELMGLGAEQVNMLWNQALAL